ncbi:hypothetical protein KAM622c_25700 [Klebsiella quasipneumoniae subsp. quasipneumoniae]|nr:hypothetical protein KAM622c_25700 [Klebsiella quasipneumoniae subsp. quasipneumoniae]
MMYLMTAAVAVLRRGLLPESVYKNDRGINLSFFCIEFGDRVNPRFYSELADTPPGLSASGAVYDVISRGRRPFRGKAKVQNHPVS